MNTPIIYEGSEELDREQLVALRQSVIDWSSKKAWRFVCEIGLVADRVVVEFGPDGFEWIIFHFEGEESIGWNPDDDVDAPEGGIALAAVLARRHVLRAEN